MEFKYHSLKKLQLQYSVCTFIFRSVFKEHNLVPHLYYLKRNNELYLKIILTLNGIK